jgi:hypothetical protein
LPGLRNPSAMIPGLPPPGSCHICARALAEEPRVVILGVGRIGGTVLRGPQQSDSNIAGS